jgi:hypothetical protein
MTTFFKNYAYWKFLATTLGYLFKLPLGGWGQKKMGGRKDLIKNEADL